MKRISTVWFITAMACSAAAGFCDDRIVAGERVGVVRIGDSRTQARAKLGKPAKSFVTHGKRSADLWQMGSAAEEIETVYVDGRVIQIRTSVDKHKTRAGLGPQGLMPSVKRAYRRLKATHYFYDTENGNGLSYHDDVRGGIAFVVPTPWKDSDKPERVYEVIVHKRGAPAIPTDIKDPSNRVTAEEKLMEKPASTLREIGQRQIELTLPSGQFLGVPMTRAVVRRCGRGRIDQVDRVV